MRIRAAGVALLFVAAACGGTSGVETANTLKVFRVGLFHVGVDHVPPSLPPLVDALQDLGYLTATESETFKKCLVSLPLKLTVQGKNMDLDWRNLADEAGANEAVKEFVRDKVDLIVAFESQTIRAAHAATTTVPVVFLHALDPVSEGFVQSLSHPGGNMTGLIGFRQLAGKQLEVFKNIMPGLRRVLAVTDPEDPRGQDLVDANRETAEARNLTLVERPATSATEIAGIFASLQPAEVDGVVIASQDLQTKFSLLMIRLALEHHLPISVGFKSRVERGGLFSYGPDFPAVGQKAAVYIDKILKGAKPADLPVEEMTELELVINQKVATDLGLTLSPQWLDAADEVIDYVIPASEAPKAPTCG
jgi:putative ABC transport system substrate-binding protein